MTCLLLYYFHKTITTLSLLVTLTSFPHTEGKNDENVDLASKKTRFM